MARISVVARAIEVRRPVAYAGFSKGGGGYFERVRSVQTILTRIFIDFESISDGLSETWGEMSRKARKFKGFFCPKSGDLQKKKKKGLRQNSEWFFGRNPKFKGVFRPKLGHLQKKKKKGLYSRSVPFFTRTHSNFQPKAWCPTYKGRGPCLNFAHFTMQFCNPSDPKGGPWHNGPPLNTPLEEALAESGGGTKINWTFHIKTYFTATNYALF